jgi:hypothetical protein
MLWRSWQSSPKLSAVVHRSPSARAGDLWRPMPLRFSAQRVCTPGPNGTVQHRDAKSGNAWHMAVGSWKRRLGDRSPTAHSGDLWRPMLLGPLGRRSAEYVTAPVSKSLPQGTRPIQLAPCGLQPPHFRRGLCMVVQGRAALCRGAKGPSAKFLVALLSQVPRSTWHSCTKRRCPTRGGKERHHPAQPEPSPECPHLSKDARQMHWRSWAVLPRSPGATAQQGAGRTTGPERQNRRPCGALRAAVLGRGDLVSRGSFEPGTGSLRHFATGWHSRARCQVPLGTRAPNGALRHHPPQPELSPEWPHLSKDARQATWAVFPVSVSALGHRCPRLIRPRHGAPPAIVPC